MVDKKILKHLDVARHLLATTCHLAVGLRTRRQRQAVGDPQVLADEHVAAVQLATHGVLLAAHLRDQQQGVQKGILQDIRPDLLGLVVLLALLLAVGLELRRQVDGVDVSVVLGGCGHLEGEDGVVGGAAHGRVEARMAKVVAEQAVASQRASQRASQAGQVACIVVTDGRLASCQKLLLLVVLVVLVMLLLL